MTGVVFEIKPGDQWVMPEAVSAWIEQTIRDRNARLEALCREAWEGTPPERRGNLHISDDHGLLFTMLGPMHDPRGVAERLPSYHPAIANYDHPRGFADLSLPLNGWAHPE